MTTARPVFQPRPHQLAFLKAMQGGCKRALLRWHRKAGKDMVCFLYMVEQMLTKVGTYYYFFPTYAFGKKALWEDIGDGMRRLNYIPKELIKRIDNTNMVIELTNGSIFRIVGAENIDSLVGCNPNGVVMSEFAIDDSGTQASLKAWNFISPALTINGGWAILNSTPRGRNYMFDLEETLKKITIKEDKWFVDYRQSVWPDQPNYTGIVSPEMIEKERAAGKSDDFIAQEYGAAYSAVTSGSYYQELIEIARESGRVGEFPPNPTLWTDTYWDLGHSDYTTIWFVQQLDGKRVVVDYYEHNREFIPFYVSILQSKGYKYRTHYLPHDGKNANVVGRPKDELVKYLGQSHMPTNVECCPKVDPQSAIHSTRLKFHTFYFNEPLVGEGLRKLELYKQRYDYRRSEYTGVPSKDGNDHAADSFRLIGTVDDLQWGKPLYDFYGRPSNGLTQNFDIFARD